MASLTGNAINTTYPGLLKFTDNLGVTGTPKDVTDGLGAGLPVQFSSNQTIFTDNVDFSAATVTGLPGGAAGLESGSGPSSMRSAAALTTTGATASGSTSIAIGNAAIAAGEYDVALGDRISLSNGFGGENAGLGTNHTVTGFTNVTMGGNINLDTTENCFVAGTNTTIGSSSTGVISLGSNNNYGSGCEASAIFGDFITLPAGTRNYYNFGGDSPVGAADPSNSIVIGTGSFVNNTSNAIAIGSSIEATRSNVLATNELELQTTGGGIYLKSPNGTEYKITVSDAGALVVALA